jgi:hypothetical protein
VGTPERMGAENYADFREQPATRPLYTRCLKTTALAWAWTNHPTKLTGPRADGSPARP